MIPATELHWEVRRKLNRFNSDHQKKMTVPAMDSILNEALELVLQNAAVFYEVREDMMLNLAPLERRDVELQVTESDKKVKAKLPEDWYKITRVVAVATNKKCNSTDKLIVRTFQTQKLSEGLISPYWKPSFEWRETIGLRDTEEYYDVYHNDDFTIDSVLIDYIKKHPRIQAPSLSEKGFYIDGYGELAKEDKGLLLDSHYQKRQICDVAALIAMRDLSDIQDFQTQLNKIIFSNTPTQGQKN